MLATTARGKHWITPRMIRTQPKVLRLSRRNLVPEFDKLYDAGTFWCTCGRSSGRYDPEGVFSAGTPGVA
jgi:hypothetical protein